MIIDTPTNLTRYAKRLVTAGVTTAFRYESRLPNAGWKRWQPDEMRAFADAGLHCAIVYEDGAKQFGHSNGVAAANYAIERCAARGQPLTTAIYYAEDADLNVAEINGPAIEFFHGVNEVHRKQAPNMRIGCYGSGFVTRTLLACKLIDLRWITCSLGFLGSRQAVAAGAYELWQSHCDTSLLGIDVDTDVSRVADFGQWAPFAKALKFPAPAKLPMVLAALSPSPQTPFAYGRGSWYSQFNGRYHWRDPGDAPGSNALHVPDNCQGISFYDGQTLGHWFELHAPNGSVSLEQQTDVGPAPSTHRAIDISAVCAERLGYAPLTFPTDGVFHWRPALAPEPVRQLSPRQQAIKWLEIRQENAAPSRAET